MSFSLDYWLVAKLSRLFGMGPIMREFGNRGAYTQLPPRLVRGEKLDRLDLTRALMVASIFWFFTTLYVLMFVPCCLFSASAIWGRTSGELRWAGAGGMVLGCVASFMLVISYIRFLLLNSAMMTVRSRRRYGEDVPRCGRPKFYDIFLTIALGIFLAAALLSQPS